MNRQSKLEVILSASIVLATCSGTFVLLIGFSLLPPSWIGAIIALIGWAVGTLSAYFAVLRLMELQAKQ